MQPPHGYARGSAGAKLCGRGPYDFFGFTSASCPEVVAAPLQSNIPFQCPELLYRLLDHLSSHATALCCAGDLSCRVRDAGVTLFGFGTELHHHGGILAPRETMGLPEQHASPALVDLLGEPLEVFPCLGVVRKDP